MVLTMVGPLSQTRVTVRIVCANGFLSLKANMLTLLKKDLCYFKKVDANNEKIALTRQLITYGN